MKEHKAHLTKADEYGNILVSSNPYLSIVAQGKFLKEHFDKSFRERKPNNMKTLRNGYKEDERTINTLFNDGYLTEWTISAPSGNQYLIAQFFDKSGNGKPFLSDVNHFVELGIFENHNDAINQIYEWEDTKTQVLPNLRDQDIVLSLISPNRRSNLMLNVQRLIDLKIIKPTLQTAIYLFTTHYSENTERDNSATVDYIMNSLHKYLSEEEIIKFYNYVISKAPDCIIGIHDNFLIKCANEGTRVPFIPNPEWLKSPEWVEDNLKKENADFDKDVYNDLERDE